MRKGWFDNGAYFMTNTSNYRYLNCKTAGKVEELIGNTVNVVEGTEASIDPFEGDNEMVKDGGNGLDLLTEENSLQRLHR